MKRQWSVRASGGRKGKECVIKQVSGENISSSHTRVSQHPPPPSFLAYNLHRNDEKTLKNFLCHRAPFYVIQKFTLEEASGGIMSIQQASGSVGR